MLTEIVLALGYNSIDKNRAFTTEKKGEKKKQSTHNSSASHRTHRVRTSKRIHMEHIESDQKTRGEKKKSTKRRERD